MNTTRNIALSLSSCEHYGTQLAAKGWTEEQVRHWVINTLGYGANGTTMARIIKYFRAQVARG